MAVENYSGTNTSSVSAVNGVIDVLFGPENQPENRAENREAVRIIGQSNGQIDPEIIPDHKHSESLVAGQVEIFEMIATGQQLCAVLDRIA
ncbi:MAG: hypothetical protein AAB401_02600, partial [Acidobacteriota bacterium]